MKTFDADLILGSPADKLGGVTRGQELIAEMDRHQVECGLVTHLGGALQDVRGGNQNLFDETRGRTDRLIPVPTVDLSNLPPDDDWQQWQRNGAKGVRICPAIHGRGAERARERLLERLKSLGWFLQIPLRLYYMKGPLGGSLKDMAEFAATDGGIKIMVCGVERDLFADLRNLLKSSENVYLDVANLCRATLIPHLVDAGFTERLVCGSGFGISYITPYRDAVLYSGIPAAARRQILYANAVDMVGWIH